MTCLYKWYQLWDVTMCNFLLKDAFVNYFDFEDVSRGKFSHRRTCMYATFHIRNHVRDHWFDPGEGLWCVFTVKNVPLRNFLTYMDVSACKFSHEKTSVYNLSHNFLCLGSTDMFPRSVSTTRRIHAHVHTLKDRCLLTFWVTKSFLCVTLNIRHHVGHQIFHRQVETMYNRMA